MIAELEALSNRIDKIEKQKAEEVLTLIEILSNVAFFGEIKQSRCEYSKDGQCSFFILSNEGKGKIPIISDCRVKQCREKSFHCHLELSKISCALCQLKYTQKSAFISQSQFKPKNSEKKNRANKNNKENQAR